MLSRKAKDNLKKMAKERSFHTEAKGDTVWGVAEGHQKRKLMYQGATTAFGSYLKSKGVHLPEEGVDRVGGSEVRRSVVEWS